MTTSDSTVEFWTFARVRARDLVPTDVALFNGSWCMISDVYTHGGDPAAQYGDDHEITRRVLEIISQDDGMWVAVRYLDLRRVGLAETTYQIAALSWCELVQTHVPDTTHNTRKEPTS